MIQSVRLFLAHSHDTVKQRWSFRQVSTLRHSVLLRRCVNAWLRRRGGNDAHESRVTELATASGVVQEISDYQQVLQAYEQSVH